MGPYLVVGLARSGLAAALALRARGETVIGVDEGEPDGLGELRDAGVELHLNEDGVALLDRMGALVKSPGVPREAPVIAAALARGMGVLGELELAWRLLSNEFIAVTGTNGKTTTVELIGHIHRSAGLAVAVAGNVGAALSGLVGRIDPQATIVCEASSFQLQDTEAFAPEAAVLLNISPDHLDRHGTMEAYAQAKLKVFARQSADDIAVVPAVLDPNLDPGARTVLEQALRTMRARCVRFGDDPGADLCERDGQLCWRGAPLLATGELSLRGRHNVENAIAAAAVCLARGVDVEAVRAGLRTFAGVEHRMEEIARQEGVLYVNDSKATNVASTLVALASFAPGRSSVGGGGGGEIVRLILGGRGKDQDFSALRDPVKRSCKAVYLIGEDAPLIASVLAGVDVPVHECGDLEHALRAAATAAQPGDVVLLSPACASFDQFADYEARGERFRELVLR